MMTKIKTVQEERGELRVLQRLSEYEFGVEVWVMREGLNRNNWDYRNLEKYYRTFLGTPILCAYVAQKIGDGHNMREKRNPKTGEQYYSFTDATAERIVGTLSDDPKDLTLQKRDGHTWIVAKGRLFAFYASELVEKIVRTGRMEVSAETEVRQTETEDGKEIFTEWSGLGVTILGDNVAPAIPGAHIAALAAMQEEFCELKLRAASLRNKPQTTHKLNRKGVTPKMNKQAIARLAPKFEGYRIVGLSDDGMRVALVDAKGGAFTYTFNEEDKGEVLAPRITPASLSTIFAMEGGDVAVDMGDIVEYVMEQTKSEDEETKALRQQLQQAQEEVKRMKDAEHARRVQAVKDAVQAKCEQIKATEDDDDEEIDEEARAIEENAEAYADMEENGEFCGDRKACDELMARCMERRLAKMNEEKKRKAKVFFWQNASNQQDASTIEGALSRINR